MIHILTLDDGTVGESRGMSMSTSTSEYSLEWLLSHDEQYRYMMLGRMQSDCEYFLGFGNRSTARLWARDVKLQIKYMKALWRSFSKESRPKWLTMAQIVRYEKAMTENKDV